MRSENEPKDVAESSTYRELRLLSEVQRAPNASQRDLSRRMGIALGLTNVLLRNLAQKGYIRVTQAGWKRWFYAVTPVGFTRKIHLTVAYIHRVLDHYQTVRQTLRHELELLDLNEESRVAIYGTGEFAELVYLGLREIRIEEIEIFGPTNGVQAKFLGMPVRDVASMRPDEFDRVVVAVLGDWESGREELQEVDVAPEKLVTFFADGQARGGHVPSSGVRVRHPVDVV